jgi:hypothetical protein
MPRTRRSASSTLNGLVVMLTPNSIHFVFSTASSPTCSIACTMRVSRFSFPFACNVFCPAIFFLMYSTSFRSFSFSLSKTSCLRAMRSSRCFK